MVPLMRHPLRRPAPGRRCLPKRGSLNPRAAGRGRTIAKVREGEEQRGDPPVGLWEADLPETFRAADLGSVSAQERFLRSIRLELIALGVAAVAGAYSWHWRGSRTDIAGVIAATSFALAGVVRTAIQRGKLERAWYDGRAVAESAKTMAWCYAVGGRPFPLGPDALADAEFVRRLGELPTGLNDLDLVPTTDGGPQITEPMRSLRRSSLEERKAVYLAGRIRGQQRWYARKARWNMQRANRWNAALLTVEAGGAVAAAVKAATDIPVDLLPAAAAIVAGAAAYLQTKQHDSLASAYSLASLELANVAELLPGVIDEAEWASFVDQAETSISREHSMWRARRSPNRRGPDERKDP